MQSVCKANSGVVKVKERPPANMKYRRRIEIGGLENATVCLFGEEYCKGDCIITKMEPHRTPVPLEGLRVVDDSENGTYMYAENISGNISICMPAKS